MASAPYVSLSISTLLTATTELSIGYTITEGLLLYQKSTIRGTGIHVIYLFNESSVTLSGVVDWLKIRFV